MVELTGGVLEKFNLTIPEMKLQIDSGEFFKTMKNYLSQGFLIGCTKVD
jgi:hypothetical protein